MSIFGKRFSEDLPFDEGEYPATMLRMDWKDTKAGDQMLLVEFRTDAGRTGKALFPQVNSFFESEAKRACKVLLGVSEPEDFQTFFRLADQKASRSRFMLNVKNHKKGSGELTQNFLIRDLNKSQQPVLDTEEIF